MLGAHGAVTAVARFPVFRRIGAKCPVQKAGFIVPSNLQVNLAFASDLPVAGNRPLLEAVGAPELPQHLVLLQHVFDDGFAHRTNELGEELLLQQREVPLHALQTLREVKLDPPPRGLVLSGLAGPPVAHLGQSSSGRGERHDGAQEPAQVTDGAEEPGRRDA